MGDERDIRFVTGSRRLHPMYRARNEFGTVFRQIERRDVEQPRSFVADPGDDGDGCLGERRVLRAQPVNPPCLLVVQVLRNDGPVDHLVIDREEHSGHHITDVIGSREIAENDRGTPRPFGVEGEQLTLGLPCLACERPVDLFQHVQPLGGLALLRAPQISDRPFELDNRPLELDPIRIVAERYGEPIEVADDLRRPTHQGSPILGRSLPPPRDNASCHRRVAKQTLDLGRIDVDETADISR